MPAFEKSLHFRGYMYTDIPEKVTSFKKQVDLKTSRGRELGLATDAYGRRKGSPQKDTYYC